MENFNTIPSAGTYGSAIALINANFSLTKEQLERLSYSREGFCGMYETDDDLEAAYPHPTTGSFAYVGTSFPMTVYLATNGVWAASSSTYSGGEIDLTQYADEASLTALAGRVTALENAGYVFIGIATPAGAPSPSQAKRFALAWAAGTYTYYGGFVLNSGEMAVLMYNGSAWSGAKTDIIAKGVVGGYDTTPTEDSEKPITSGGVYTAMDELRSDMEDELSNVDMEFGSGEYVSDVIIHNIVGQNESVLLTQGGITSFVFNEIDINDIDNLNNVDYAYSPSQSQSKKTSYYTVVTFRGTSTTQKVKIGTMAVISDGLASTVTEVMTTRYVLDASGNLTGEFSNNDVFTIYRSTSGNTWTQWHYVNESVWSEAISGIRADLTNYYTKSQTYSKTEVDGLIAAINQFNYVVAPSLPTPTLSTMGVIYLIPSASGSSQNIKDEFITIREDNWFKWEQIGSTAVDLSGYSTTAEMNAAINAAIASALISYYTKTQVDTLLDEKQDVIDDLATIRSGAAAGATAVQPAAMNSAISSAVSTESAHIRALIGYYECSTAAATASKAVSASGYTLTNGGCIRIKMMNGNTADNVTLNINSTGAKALYYDGAQASSSNSWEAGEVLEVYYDGTQYQCASGGGGKFATGEKVKDTSITDEVDGSDALVTSAAVEEEFASRLGGTFGIDSFTKTENTAVAINHSTMVVSNSASNNYDKYKVVWENGGNLHVILGGVYNNDSAPISFYSSEEDTTENLITYLNSNESASQFETTIEIPEGTKSIVVCNKKSVLTTPTIEIVVTDQYSQQIHQVEQKLETVYDYGIEKTVDSPLSNGSDLVKPLPINAGHCYQIKAEKLTSGAPDIMICMGSNGEMRKLVQDSLTFFYIPHTSSESARLYTNNSVVAGYQYRFTIDDLTQPDTLPMQSETQPDVFLRAEGNELKQNVDEIDYYLSDVNEYKVEKSGVMTTGNTTFMDGFPIVAGHEYKITFVSDTPVGKTFSIGFGSNGQFTPNISSTTDTTVPQTRTKVATTSTDNSRIYFQFSGAPDSYPNITVKLEDLTEPTTFPKVVVHAGLETKLQTEIDNIAAIAGGGGGGFSSTLFIGTLSVGLWSTSGRTSTAGLCSDKMVYPWNSMRVQVKLPQTLSCMIVTGDNLAMTAQSNWLVDGDVYAMPISHGNHKYNVVRQYTSYYAVCFSDTSDHTQCSVAKADLENYIKEGAVALVVDGKETSLIAPLSDSDRYVRRKHDETKLVIVHISDVHGDRQRYNRALNYADSLAASALINTGDSVSYNITDGCMFIPDDALKHDVPVLTAVGNHDMIGNTSSIWFQQITQPLVEKCGYMKSANTPATDNNYYVDIADDSVRCIVLENYFGKVYNNNDMAEWLVSALASVPSGYGVIICEHTLDKMGTGNVFFDGTPGEFTALNLRGIVDLFISGTSGTVTVKSGYDVTCDFTQAQSHEFICWLAGHSHVDFVGYYDDTTNRQVVCQVDSTCAVQGTATLPRDIEGSIQDSFNIFQVDRTNHKILAMKVGSNVTTADVSLTTAEISYI